MQWEKAQTWKPIVAGGDGVKVGVGGRSNRGDDGTHQNQEGRLGNWGDGNGGKSGDFDGGEEAERGGD